MKTKYLAIVLIASLLVLPMMSAESFWQTNVARIKLVEKNPTDWTAVEKGAYGNLNFVSLKSYPFGKFVVNRVNLEVFKLTPFTDYQLIYYGADGFNDVWNHATCIGNKFKTNIAGNRNLIHADFDVRGMINDGIAQKFWVVKASDVDCTNKVMTAWNPSAYLFETATI